MIYSLIQYKQKLYLINVRNLSEALFYQRVLFNFTNHVEIKFKKPLELNKLLTIAYKMAYPDKAASSSTTNNSSLIDDDINNDQNKENQSPHSTSAASSSSSSSSSSSIPDLSSFVSNGIEFLTSRASMLREYFGIVIESDSSSFSSSSSATLVALPLLLAGYQPALAHLPAFLYHLILCCDWKNEKLCLNQIAKCLSKLYQLTDEKYY